MGASEFIEIAEGATAREAFNRAVEDALYESGHGGYSGTIAEKDGATVFTPDLSQVVDPAELAYALGTYHWDSSYDDLDSADTDALVDRAFGRDAQRAVDIYNDKWGPAVCFQLPDGKWLFCGIASS